MNGTPGAAGHMPQLDTGDFRCTLSIDLLVPIRQSDWQSREVEPMKEAVQGITTGRRFSTVLMVTIITLVTFSVILILTVVNRHFNRRMEREFEKKVKAHSGQAEIILRNRIAEIQGILQDLGSDNTVRVTMMLGTKPQLYQRITDTYPSGNGVYHFVQKYGDATIFPEGYPEFSRELTKEALKVLPYGETIKDGSGKTLLWVLTSPIMNTNRRMGTAYALYSPANDQKLIEAVHTAVEGELIILEENFSQILTSGDKPAFSLPALSVGSAGSDMIPVDSSAVLVELNGFDNLYLLSSLKTLNQDKRRLAILTAFFSALALAVSVLISVFVGRKMVNPLRDMTRKAIQISQGEKDLGFDTTGGYWEFGQLSRAFNYMLSNLKDAEERSRYKELLENVDDAVYIMDTEGRILDANAAAYLQLGYPPDAFFRLTLAQIVPADDAGKILADLTERDGGSGEVKKMRLETVHLKENGDHLPVDIISRAITYRGQPVILNVARDISRRVEIEKEKQQLEAQLLHAQKMEAIGTLAGGIAHDFNNLLMGIQGRISMIRAHSDPEQPHYRHVDQIEKTVTSAANLTKQLLGFARKGKYQIQPTCINTLVEDSTRMFIRSRKEINLSLDCDQSCRTVQVDRGQIEQVLINLYVNAWHAMPEGGDLNIRTVNVDLDEAFCRPHEVSSGPYVRVSVADTGIGIDPKIIDRIFEPFFTTKGTGKGTGLGLASAYGIVKNHSGIIQVESQKGKGTTFDIFLPASLETVEKIDPHPPAVTGRGTVLVADDEEETLLAAEMMLNELGYRVLKANGGREAVRMYRENATGVDLVVVDMVMPGLSGGDTYEQLKTVNPAVKVLLMSGFSQSRMVEKLLETGCAGFLQKPFDTRTLSVKIHEVLQQQQGSGLNI
jgi:PAS domain S-box-containing protein